MYRVYLACVFFFVLLIQGCAAPESLFKPARLVHDPQDLLGHEEQGLASWYGPRSHGQFTASGEVYNMYAMTAAHKNLPFDTRLQVTNLDNEKQITVRINDRGPFVQGRILDLSYAAARKLDLIKAGTAPVHIKVLETPASLASKE